MPEKEPYIKIIVNEPGYGTNDNVQLFVNGEKIDKAVFVSLTAFVGEAVNANYATVNIEKTKEENRVIREFYPL